MIMISFQAKCSQCFNLPIDHEKDDEDIDGVSVGGMDVSDIDDDEDQPPKTSRGPPPRRGPPGQPSQQQPRGPQGPPSLRAQQAPGPGPGPKPSFQPRYPPRPPAQSQYTPAMVSVYVTIVA